MEFIVAKVEKYRVGLLKNIFDILIMYEKLFSGSPKSNVFELIDYGQDSSDILNYVSEIKETVSNEEISLGMDGIVCLDLE